MEAGLGWTDDRVAMLRRLWEDGQSASKIAAQLGGVTRNAVIGKVHRLGLRTDPVPVHDLLDVDILDLDVRTQPGHTPNVHLTCKVHSPQLRPKASRRPCRVRSGSCSSMVFDAAITNGARPPVPITRGRAG